MPVRIQHWLSFMTKDVHYIWLILLIYINLFPSLLLFPTRCKELTLFVLIGVNSRYHTLIWCSTDSKIQVPHVDVLFFSIWIQNQVSHIDVVWLEWCFDMKYTIRSWRATDWRSSLTAASQTKELEQLALDCHLAIHSMRPVFFPTAKGDQANRNDTADPKVLKGLIYRSNPKLRPFLNECLSRLKHFCTFSVPTQTVLPLPPPLCLHLNPLGGHQRHYYRPLPDPGSLPWLFPWLLPLPFFWGSPSLRLCVFQLWYLDQVKVLIRYLTMKRIHNNQECKDWTPIVRLHNDIRILHALLRFLQARKCSSLKFHDVLYCNLANQSFSWSPKVFKWECTSARACPLKIISFSLINSKKESKTGIRFCKKTCVRFWFEGQTLSKSHCSGGNVCPGSWWRPWVEEHFRWWMQMVTCKDSWGAPPDAKCQYWSDSHWCCGFSRPIWWS